MTNDKNDIQQHLEEVFQEMRPELDAPKSLKEKLFEALEDIKYVEDEDEK